MLPGITVYILNYNYGEFVAAAIESVLNQTYRNFELIVIDDGSTDGSREILHHYCKNPKINLVLQPRKGFIKSCNVAIGLAKGRYIIRLDADDVFYPQILDSLYNEMIKNENTGYVFCDYFETDASGDVKIEKRQFNKDLHGMISSVIPHGACLLIRLSFLRQISGYPESIQCQDGTYLWKSFKDKFNPAYISKPLFEYRRHGKNMSNNISLITTTRQEILGEYQN